jgi:hypothetical protein
MIDQENYRYLPGSYMLGIRDRHYEKFTIAKVHWA